MAEPFIGQIMAVAFNFAPVGWLRCDGQTIAISEFEALFTLIGTTYGGDGQTNFSVPNLNGRVPVGVGTSQTGTTFILGEVGGSENVTLTAGQIGSHAHPLMASVQPGSTNTPGPGEVLAENAQPAAFMYAPPPVAATMSPAAITPTGDNNPHENRQPYLAITYIINTAGIFPSQS